MCVCACVYVRMRVWECILYVTNMMRMMILLVI